MKIIYNKYFPPKPFYAINILCIVFVRKDCGELSRFDINHEAIHSRQMKEFFFLPFYFLYLSEWLWKLILYKNTIRAYRNISFEREAYDHETDLNYLSKRALWANLKYIRKNR